MSAPAVFMITLIASVVLSCGGDRRDGDDVGDAGTKSEALSQDLDATFTASKFRAAAGCAQCEVVHGARLHLPETGVNAASAKLLLADGSITGVTIDETGKAADEGSLIAAERAAAKAKYGKTRPELHAWAQTASETDRIWVWARVKAPVDFGPREDAHTAAGEKVQAAVAKAIDKATAPVHAWLAANASEAEYGDFGGPIIRAYLTAAEVRGLELLADVDQLGTDDYPGKPQGSPWSSSSQWGASIRLNDALALATGSGTKVCVKEDKRPDDVSHLVIAATAGSSGATSSHARVSAGILRNTDTSTFTGVAPSTQVYIANWLGYSSVDAYCEAQGTETVSYSYAVNGGSSGAIGATDMQHDWMAKQPPYILVVSSAGAIDVGTDTYVANRGFDGLVVGGINDQNTADRSDDTWDTASAWKNPTTTHGDFELPNLVAPSNGVDVAGTSGNGTSAATAIVAGVDALMESRGTDLFDWPEEKRAVLLATATGRADQGLFSVASAGDQKIGAGMVDAYQAVDLASSSNSATAGVAALKGRTAMTLTFSSSFGTDGNLTPKYKVQVTQNGRLRVAMAWDASATCTSADGTCSADPQDADLDLQLYHSDATSTTITGSAVCTSSTYDSTWEACDFPVTAGQYYLIAVHKYATTASSTYFGLAWYQYQQPSGSSCSSGSDCASGTCTSGRCSCSTGTDCPDRYCTSGLCSSQGPNGSTCSTSAQCVNGHCVDGVCCSSACSRQDWIRCRELHGSRVSRSDVQAEGWRWFRGCPSARGGRNPRANSVDDYRRASSVCSQARETAQRNLGGIDELGKNWQFHMSGDLRPPLRVRDVRETSRRRFGSGRDALAIVRGITGLS